MVPNAAQVAVLWDRASVPILQAAEAAAGAQKWKLLSLEVRDAGEIDAALEVGTTARVGALLATGGLAFRHTAQINELAVQSKLPAMYSTRLQVEAGGLMSYGPDFNEIWRRAATFVDKILKGGNPADLPVEQPTKYELVINLKTAKALGLEVPATLLARADEVIE